VLGRKNVSVQGYARERAGIDHGLRRRSIATTASHHRDSVKNMLYIASLDNYLTGLKSLVRKGKPHPVLAIRTQLSAHLRENLKTLGLKRVSKALTVTDVLNGQDEAAATQNAEGMQ